MKTKQRPHRLPATTFDETQATKSMAQQKSQVASPTKAKAIQLANANRPAVAKPNRAQSAVAEAMCAAAGVSDPEIALRIICQMAELQAGRPDDADQKLCEALAMLEELKPTNAMESLLAVQMFHVHERALKFLQTATIEGQTVAGCDANVSRAMKLMRMYIDQLTAMQKLKGKAAQQRVTVEHVHVHQGGQAIVGAVAAPTGGQEGSAR